MSAEQFTYLSNKNYHERDSHIVFDEPNHIYTVNGDPNYVSVTTFVKSHFSSFDADSVIKNIMNSKNGTVLTNIGVKHLNKSNSYGKIMQMMHLKQELQCI